MNENLSSYDELGRTGLPGSISDAAGHVLEPLKMSPALEDETLAATNATPKSVQHAFMVCKKQIILGQGVF